MEGKYGELETGDNSTVVTATFGNGSGTFTTTVVGGIATFTNVLDDTAATTTLEFSSGNLVATTSNEIVVVPAAVSQLVVTQQPSTSATAAESFPIQPVVAEEDQFGNVITTDSTSTVTAVVGDVGTASLQGTDLMVTLLNGVAPFAGLSYNKAELMNISFSTDASGVSSVTSKDVLVIPSAATQLVIAQEPSKTAIAGSPFQTEPVVYEEDKYGNVETGDNSTVISAMQFTGKGPLAGALNATVSGGVATFATMADTRAETTMLQFVSGTLFSSPTTQIVVSPATASSLIVVTQPSPNDTAGQAFPVQPVVEEVDQYGNLETGDNSSQVSVSSSGAGTLLNSSPVTVSGGIATFSGLQDNTAEDPTLTFSVGNLTPAVSSLFTVVAGAPYKLAITRKPAGVVQAGNAIPFVVDAQDMYGNTATSFSGQVTAVLASGPGSLGGTTVMTAVNGEADFTDLYSTATGSITLSASGTASDGTSLTAPATTSIPVGPGKAAQLVFYQEPWPNATAGQAFRTQPAVYEEDAYGNIETADSQTVVTVSSTGVGKLQGGSTTATVLDGIATFSGLLDNTAETIALDFTSPGLTAAVSTNVVVSPAALDHIMIHTPPSSTATAGQAFGTQPVIWELDQYGNIETGDNSSQVTAALASGTGPLEGTTTVTVQGGIATFTNLADDLAETITLSFSVLDTSITAGPSSSIVVSVGAASRLLIRVQPPSSATAGQVFGTSVVISEVDANGNVETSDNSTVISAAPSGGPAVLEGTQATVQAGVATFTGLVDDTAGTLELLFTGNGLTSPASNPVFVSPAGLYQLTYTQPPPTGTAGQPFVAVIHEEDKFGNLETTDNLTQFSASLASGAGPLTGTTVTVSGGVATFSLVDDTAETITLDFSGGGLTTGPSNNVVINPAAPAALVIKTEPPPSVQAGQSFGAVPVLWEEDQYHNLETMDSSTRVTAFLDSGAGPLLGAATPVTLIDGVATFSSLADDTAETITLGFSGGGLTAGPSTKVVINPGPDFKLFIATAPSSPSPAGQAFATEPVVYVEDQYGNLETGDNSRTVSVSLAAGSGPLQGAPSVIVQGGKAEFSGLADDLAETIALRFVSNGLNTVTSGSFAVNPAAAGKLVISTEPSASATAGQAFGTQPVILEEDQYGNLEKSDNSSAVTVSLNSGSGPLQGGASATVVGGVATFSNLVDTLAETITLRFTSGNLSAVSNPITVVSAPSTAPAPTIDKVALYAAPPRSKKAKKTVTGFQLTSAFHNLTSNQLYINK